MRKRIIGSLFLLFLIFSNVVSQEEEIQFLHLNRKKGFLGKSVLSIAQDSRNFIWFGTDAGLNRYDGYNFKVFRGEPLDSHSISSTSVTCLFEDSEHVLWVGTEYGLNRFERSSETFLKFYSKEGDKNALVHNYIHRIVEDKKGNIIVGTSGGLCIYDRQFKTFSQPEIINRTEISIGKPIQILEILPDGNLFIVTNRNHIHIIERDTWNVIYAVKPNTDNTTIYSGLLVDNEIFLGMDNVFLIFNFQNRSIKQVNIPKKYGTIKGIISSFAHDKANILWLGTSNNGIFTYDLSKAEFKANFLFDELNPIGLSGQDISVLYFDKTGKLWAGSWGSGINYYHPDIIKYKHFFNSSLAPFNLPGNKINAVFEDSQKKIWVATERGFAQYHFQHGKIERITATGIMKQNNYPILSIYEDSMGDIWAGSYIQGLFLFDKPTGSLKNVTLSEKYSVCDIIETEPGNLWLATMSNGIVQYNISRKEEIKRLIPSIDVLFIVKFVQDTLPIIWIGTAHGLYKVNSKDLSMVQYLHDVQNPQSISSNHIFDILLDGQNRLLIATPNGLNVYNRKKEVFVKINQNDGLENDYITSIECDNAGRIWLSTLKGLSCVQLDSEYKVVNILNYSVYDGLQNAEFREKASAKLQSGILLFGGNYGINYFNPENIRSYSYDQEAIITNLFLHNKEILPGDTCYNRIILKNSITETDKIILKHSENDLQLEFSALNAIIPEKCKYRYKLTGVDPDWVFCSSTDRKVNYTNLDPGKYTFIVSASNSDGIWSNYSDSLNITILQPYWKTKWAKGTYILLLFILLLILRRLIIRNERKKNQEKIVLRETKKQQELDKLKIKFFTNISHEFRTPLTLIITPLEKIIKNLKHKELEVPLNTMYRNSKRLLNLVNQLLDFRKMEVSGLKLIVSTGDMVSYLKDIVFSFGELAEKKHISLKFFSNVNEYIMQFDHDKIEKIMFNLLSNAFKYTLENGEVKVSLMINEKSSENKQVLQIKVCDNGIGIPANKLPFIFERFVQAESSGKILEYGTGIGLSLVQEFIKLHKGSIDVVSIEGKGSCFKIILPVRSTLQLSNNYKIGLSDHSEVKNELRQTTENKNKKTILIVEDSDDLRSFLHENLKENYSIHEAENGKSGFEKALEFKPDVIICDIMMPLTDGVELCQMIKENATTSHIPVILLTAKSSEEEKLAGYSGGADEYITKPFSFEVLEMRIKNLIYQREKLKQIFNRKIEINPSEISVTTADERLIQKAMSIVENNMSNSDFTVELLGRELGMSRVHLYKKILALTGKSPIEFIRIIRLKRAAQLLKKSQMRISEIAYEVGFNNPKYFSKYFKEEFKMLPSEYAQKYFSKDSSQTI